MCYRDRFTERMDKEKRDRTYTHDGSRRSVGWLPDSDGCPSIQRHESTAKLSDATLDALAWHLGDIGLRAGDESMLRKLVAQKLIEVQATRYDRYRKRKAA